MPTNAAEEIAAARKSAQGRPAELPVPETGVGQDSAAATSLCDAVERGNLFGVSQLLAKHPQLVNARKPTSFTSVEGRQTPNSGHTLLMLAMRRGSEPMVDLLIEQQADINLQDAFGKTAAMIALEFGHGAMLARKNLGDVNRANMWHQTLIHGAILWGSVQIIQELVDLTKYSLKLDSALEDPYTLAAAHGRAHVIECLLASDYRQSVIKQSRTSSQMNLLANRSSSNLPSNRTSSTMRNTSAQQMSHRSSKVTPALLKACINGHFIPRLYEEHADELNEADDEGITMLMHALLRGHDKVACALVRRGVNVNATTGDSSVGHMAMLALKYGASVSTIALLLRKGMKTGIPALSQYLEPDECRRRIFDTSHCIGYMLNEAWKDPSKYKVVRMLLSSAFIEEPGAALCAAVCIATSMLAHSEKVRLHDLDLYHTLEEESQELGECVGALIDSLPFLERERLLNSPEGVNFLALAAASQRRKMLSAPPVHNHLSRRWYGDLLFAILHGEGVYQWGGPVLLGRRHRVGLAVLTMCVVFPLNLAVMVIIAVFPPMKSVFQRFLASCGSEGIDPRVAGLESYKLGLRESTADGGAESGYSPRLLLWWRAFLILDVPIIKFFLVQLTSLVMLLMIATLTPCFDYDGTEGCFGTSVNHSQMVGAGHDFIEHFVEEIESGSAIYGRSLGAAAAKRNSADGDVGGEEYGKQVAAAWHSASWMKGMPKDGTFILMCLFAFSTFLSAIALRPSPASAMTPLTAMSSSLILAFFALDYVQFLDFDAAHDIQPLLIGLAAFLQSLDIGRALLLQTFVCGPFVLMLFHMIADLLVWLALSLVFVISFALALYLNVVVRGEAIAVAYDCSLEGPGFGSYVYLLLEVLLGLDSKVTCFKERGDKASVTLMHTYLLVGLILLLNVLIAMMAKTFDLVRDEQELNYNYLFARILVSAELDQGDIPPPVSLLRIPASLLMRIGRAMRGYSQLEEDWLRLPFHHQTSAFLLEKLTEIDDSSDENNMLTQIHRIRDDVEREFSRGDQTGADDVVNQKDDYPVRVYDGFFEEASRLVFPYGEHFQHLSEPPILFTINQFGNVVSEPKELPTRLEHDPEGGMKKLKSRAIITYAVPMEMDPVDGASLVERSGERYVHVRANGTYGISRVWTAKYNDEFMEKFDCSTANNDRSTFNPQAAYEFASTINSLFGAGATRRVPIVYAKLSQRNNNYVYVGKAEDLQAFLRRRPDVVDLLRIAQLTPSGFMSVVSKSSAPQECTALKSFDFAPGVTYALYTKVGFETMTMAKALDTFLDECTLGNDITARDDMDAVEKTTVEKPQFLKANQSLGGKVMVKVEEESSAYRV